MAQTSASWDDHVPATAEAFRDHGRTVVVLHGEFDLATVDVLTDLLANTYAADPGDVVIDLQDVQFMGAVALEAMLRRRDLLARRSRSLTVREPSLAAALTLGLGGCEDLLEHHPATAARTAPPHPLRVVGSWVPPRGRRILRRRGLPTR